MTEITPAFIKGHFHHLVRAVGGTEAAGVYLGVSHQRVSQLQSVHSADMPTILQVLTLEQAVGRSVVFSALARAVEGAAAEDIRAAAVDAVTTGAQVLRLVSDKTADGRIDAAELQEIRRAAHDHLGEAQELVDAAQRLKPGAI